jgi:glycosyltransferase involved in cell wall biosynthesis
MKEIAIIGTMGIPAKYGGFETLVEYLTKNLGIDFNFTVYCSLKNYDDKLDHYNNAKLKYINLQSNGFQSVLYDIISILRSIRNTDVLLILGVSGCIVLPVVKIISKKRVIVNIDGLEWKRAKWGRFAKLFLKFSEKLAVKYADVLITDNKIITDYVEIEYGVKSSLIAYGADHVCKDELDDDLRVLFPFLLGDYAFKVCRIEPENNIHLILKAFIKLPNRNLVIVGNWDNSSYGKKLKSEYSDLENIYLIDPIYNQKILNQIRSNCSVYIHGHSAGGTNPSLVEAMFLSLPVIAYDVEYNRETTQHMACYFGNEIELITILENHSALEFAEIATNMKIIAEKEFTWGIISEKYRSILN